MPDEPLTSEPIYSKPLDNTHPFGDLSHPFRSTYSPGEPTMAALTHGEMATHFDKITGSGGLLEQAREAQAKGTLIDFFKQLMTQLGPLLGPLFIQIISSLLHIPIVAPPATPAS